MSARRLLLLSAFYPPYEIGGWEQLTRDLAEALARRGHTVQVLTSRYGLDDGHAAVETSPAGVVIHRRLTLEADQDHYRPLDFLLTWEVRLQRNLEATRQVVTAFQPEVVCVQGMWNLSPHIPALLEQLLPGRVVYYLANDWPYAPDVHHAYWEAAASDLSAAGRLLRRLLGGWAAPKLARTQPKLAFEQVWCVSQAVRRALLERLPLSPARVRVIYNGVELEQFQPRPQDGRGGPLRLLYAGSLAPHKGVHTAIAALAEPALAAQPQITLDLLGSGHPDYEVELRAQAARLGLAARVRFLGRAPREEMAARLAGYDVLVFPSIWEEPLARSMQEGMAAGLVVVGTLTGGSGEALVEGETGLTFPPGDAAALAAQIARLQADPALRAALAAAARRQVEAKFSFAQMVVSFEAALMEVAAPDLAAEVTP